MSAGGRPTSLTPEVRAKVLEALRVGLSRAAAAGRAGIGERTLREWLARTDDVEPYASFRAEVEAAEALCEARLSAVVFKAALEDPNQARWLLERRFPKQWARRAVDKSDKTGDTTDEERRGSLEKFMRRKPNDSGADGESTRPFWRKPAAAPEGEGHSHPPWKKPPAGTDEPPRHKPWEMPDEPDNSKPS